VLQLRQMKSRTMTEDESEEAKSLDSFLSKLIVVYLVSSIFQTIFVMYLDQCELDILKNRIH